MRKKQCFETLKYVILRKFSQSTPTALFEMVLITKLYSGLINSQIFFGEVTDLESKGLLKSQQGGGHGYYFIRVRPSDGQICLTWYCRRTDQINDEYFWFDDDKTLKNVFHDDPSISSSEKIPLRPKSFFGQCLEFLKSIELLKFTSI